MPTQETPWTPAHVDEALVHWHELIIESIRVPCGWTFNGYNVTTEADFRRSLAGAGLDEQRIRRAVRRVRGLAEGKLVRAMSREYNIARDDGERPARFSSRSNANDYVNSPSRPTGRTYRVVPVRVARIRCAG